MNAFEQSHKLFQAVMRLQFTFCTFTKFVFLQKCPKVNFKAISLIVIFNAK
jgi:hypothetical protein